MKGMATRRSQAVMAEDVVAGLAAMPSTAGAGIITLQASGLFADGAALDGTYTVNTTTGVSTSVRYDLWAAGRLRRHVSRRCKLCRPRRRTNYGALFLDSAGPSEHTASCAARCGSQYPPPWDCSATGSLASHSCGLNRAANPDTDPRVTATSQNHARRGRVM